MLAMRQIIDDPQDVITIPPEYRHRRTEVIFMMLDPEAIPTNESKQKLPRANWFDGYDATQDVDLLESLPIDEAIEEWEW